MRAGMEPSNTFFFVDAKGRKLARRYTILQLFFFKTFVRSDAKKCVPMSQNSVRCQACPSGTFSERLVDSIGVTYICSACPLGTSQASGASLKCEPCDKGTYQDELGSQSCKRCPLGTYQDQEGQAQCIAPLVFR